MNFKESGLNKMKTTIGPKKNDLPLRRGAKDLSSGKALFIDDLPLGDDWHGGTVRSTIAHGRLVKLHFDPAVDWNKVVVVTMADIPGENIVVCHDLDQPALCDGIIRHQHEPLALVAAPNMDVLHQALNAIRPEYEPWPALFEMEEAIDSRIKIFKQTNIFREISITKGDPAGAILKAPVVVETTHFTQAQEHVYIEPQGMRAEWTNENSVLIQGSMQCPYYLVDGVSRLMNLPSENVRVVAMQTGGGFGGKEDFPTMLAGHVALLSKKAGCPVRMIYTRKEDMQATTKRHPARVRRRTGLNDRGEILGIEIDLILDGGAYSTLSPFVLSRAALHTVGPYRCENVTINARVVATNHPPNGGFRGFGCPQVHFAGETHMDNCAEKLNLDPVAFRRMNLLKPGDTMPTGQVLGDENDVEQVLTDALVKSHYFERKKKIDQSNSQSGSQTGPEKFKKSGIGLALFMHGTGLNEFWEHEVKSRVQLKCHASGQIEVLTAQTEFGQGTLTTLALIAAEATGLSPQEIIVGHPDTATAPNSGPTVASRTNAIIGSLLMEAGQKFQAFIREQLGEEYLKSPGSIKNAIVELMKKTASKMVFESEYHPPSNLDARDGWKPRDAYPAYTWSCCVAEIETDTLTGETRAVQIHTSQDVGHVIHPLLAAGQVRSGVAQGIGWALMEKCVWDGQGGMKNANLADYCLPSIMDVPPIGVSFLEIPSPRTLHGAKGLGELAMEGPAPAIANALAHAVNHRFFQLPILAHDILKSCGEVEK